MIEAVQNVQEEVARLETIELFFYRMVFMNAFCVPAAVHPVPATGGMVTNILDLQH